MSSHEPPGAAFPVVRPMSLDFWDERSLLQRAGRSLLLQTTSAAIAAMLGVAVFVPSHSPWPAAFDAVDGFASPYTAAAGIALSAFLGFMFWPVGATMTMIAVSLLGRGLTVTMALALLVVLLMMLFR